MMMALHFGVVGLAQRSFAFEVEDGDGALDSVGEESRALAEQSLVAALSHVTRAEASHRQRHRNASLRWRKKSRRKNYDDPDFL